jgi:GMP synthase (glutamine-hydrolysing)
MDICGCRDCGHAANIMKQIARVRAQVGSDEVILGLSGGVDSSVVAALLHKAIGDQLTCVFVDNGLLRLNEGDQVMAMFARKHGRQGHPRRCDRAVHGASEGRFRPGSQAQDHRSCSSSLRRAEAAKLANAKWLAQGTIYPDVIESAGSQDRQGHMPSRATTTSAACRST